MSVTESFLHYRTLPYHNEKALIDLNTAAVTIMSHLDRLAKPYNPTPIFCNMCKSVINSALLNYNY